MNTKSMFILFALAAAISLSGCAVMGHHSMTGMNHHSTDSKATAVVKSLEKDGLYAELSVPPLQVGKPTLISLALADKVGDCSTAFVEFSFDDGQSRMIDTYQVIGGDGGKYSIEYTPRQNGEMTVISEIYGLPDFDPIRLQTLSEVAPPLATIWSSSTTYIVGGIGMGIMMLWMSGLGRH